MKTMKLSTKLLASYVALALIGVVIGLIGIRSIVSLNDEVQKMYVVNTKPSSDVADLAIAFQRMRNNIRDIVIDTFVLSKDAKAYQETIAELDRKISEILPLVEASLQTEEGKQLLADLKNNLAKFGPVKESIIALAKNGKKEEAMSLMRGEAGDLARNIDGVINKIFTIKVALAKKGADDSNAESRATMIFSSVVTLVGVLAAIVLGILLTRSITRPINKAIDGMKDGSDQIASASSQVAAASQSLAEGSSEQAASIEETSSSMEEMSSMTKQNADHAGQANAMMKEANEVVRQANGSMKELTRSMDEIAKASDETSKIIKTIDEIAFQTNLLALNAAVEAARAGDAGSGFAVVAGEVRNLAMRAAEAAKNTAGMIEGTVKKVKEGSELVTRTNEAFSKVAVSAEKVGTLVAEIATASDEQAKGIDQVNKAVMEMEKVTQQNAANAEESASASEEMNAQAEHMKGYVEELVALVGGRANGHTAPAEPRLSAARPAAEKAIPAATAAAQKKGRVVKPSDVIPLEEGDFKSF
jgi:methyl-accepting chemotaxis protein